MKLVLKPVFSSSTTTDVIAFLDILANTASIASTSVTRTRVNTAVGVPTASTAPNANVPTVAVATDVSSQPQPVTAILAKMEDPVNLSRMASSATVLRAFLATLVK